jgi:Raf kinase inhibitor-like YbhB/YbcL family protein
MASLTVSSPAFAAGGTIPRRHTCDGPDLSPPLSWTPGPAGTAAYALVVDDPDARGFVHWVAFDIPATTTAIPEGASGSGAFGEGRNDFGRVGWGGPCPPSGTHHYVFTVFALDRRLDLTRGTTASELRRAMAGHVLAQGTLTGTYRRA